MKGQQHHPKISKELCQQYLNQLEVIRILFLLVRSKHIDSEQKREYKKKLKGAQRYLANLQGQRKSPRGQGDLVVFDESVLKHWKTKEMQLQLLEKIMKVSKYMFDVSIGVPIPPLAPDFKIDIFIPVFDPNSPKYFMP